MNLNTSVEMIADETVNFALIIFAQRLPNPIRWPLRSSSFPDTSHSRTTCTIAISLNQCMCNKICTIQNLDPASAGKFWQFHRLFLFYSLFYRLAIFVNTICNTGVPDPYPPHCGARVGFGRRINTVCYIS